MIQRLKAARPTAAKWCVIALVLLAPGALIVLPVLWLVSLFRGQRGIRAAAGGQPPVEGAQAPAREPSAASG